MRYIPSLDIGNGVNIQRWVRPLLIVSALVVALMSGLVGVSQLKFTSFLSDSINGRLEVVATTAAQDFAAATDLGLSLEQVANGEAILERARRHDSTITAVYVVDINGEILHSAGDAPQVVDAATFGAFSLAASGAGNETWDTEDDESIRSGALIEGSLGQPIGGVVLEYPSHELLEPSRSMARSLVAIGMFMSLVIIVVSGAVMVIADRRDNEQDPGTATKEQEPKHSRAFAIALTAVLILGVVGFGVLTVPAFNSKLAPELERRAALIGETIVDDTQRAVDIGIPITKLVGVDEYFDEYFARFPEINHLGIRTTDGTALYSLDRITDAGAHNGPPESDIYQFAIGAESVQAGVVEVGVNTGFVNSRLRDLALDVIVILIVALVIMFEVFHVAGRSLSPLSSAATEATAATEADRGVAGIRMVLFLFVVGEELSKSFLPLFIESVDNPIPNISSSVAISLPIAAYLLAIAVASPFSSRLINAFGTRGLFLIGVVPAALSHLGMVHADSVVQIVALRTLTGVGYALATIACLDHVLDKVGKKGRAKGIGAFVAVVIGGTFVGTALGGIVADRLGYSTVFLISFALVVTAGLLGLRLLTRANPGLADRNNFFSIRDIGVVLRQPSLMVLMAGVTVPMNVLMAAFLWYLVPITMASIGSTAAAIARTLMVYYLVILLGSPVVARMSARGVKNWAFVGFGSVMSGVILIVPAMSPTVLSISIAVLVVGIGHAAVRGPQIDLAIEIAERELPGVGRDPVLAAMRSMERLGSLVGLLVVAILIVQFDLSTAIAAVGTVSAVAGVAYISLRRSTARSRIDA